MNAQQEKMKTCNADATGNYLKGEDRQAFMKTCLSHEHEESMGKHEHEEGAAKHVHEEVAAKAHEHEEAGAKANSQQEKMKSCNKEAGAKGLKGADRRSFMSGCLKGSGSEAK